MATKTENTVPENAMCRNGFTEKPKKIPRSRFRDERNYLIARQIVSQMLAAEQISASDFVQIDTKLKEKFTPLLGSLSI